MTSKQIYEATAIELSKVQAPTLKLYEFNYFFNQAIRLFVNKVYNVYDVNQQTTDDLRVLKATVTLKPEPASPTGIKSIDYLLGSTYFINMPDDYLHLLNCICLFDVKKDKDCWSLGDVMVVGATKLTADSWSNVVDDVYNRPTSKRPYYYIHNQNEILTVKEEDSDIAILSELNSELPTDNFGLHKELVSLEPFISNYWSTVSSLYFSNLLDYQSKESLYDMLMDSKHLELISNSAALNVIKEIIKEVFKDSNIDNSGIMMRTIGDKKQKLTFYNFVEIPRTFEYAGELMSVVEKPAGSRHANTSKVKIEIRCGRSKSNVFDLSAVQIDYVKAPQLIKLTQEQLDSDEDISQIMEFPDYVNQEIINELVNLIMRKNNDPTLQAHILMTLSIARPTGQLQ